MPAPERGDLPLPDYDHLPLTSVKDRIRSLSAPELEQLLEHKQAHADRLPVVSAMRSRLEQLDEGAPPSGGAQEPRPEQPEGLAGDSPVTPAGSPEPIHPPPHGVPGPAKPKADREIG